MKSNVIYITYLIYMVFFLTLVLGGTGYAVFKLGHSGLWFILAIVLCDCAFKPSRWAELMGDKKS